MFYSYGVFPAGEKPPCVKYSPPLCIVGETKTLLSVLRRFTGRLSIPNYMILQCLAKGIVLSSTSPNWRTTLNPFRKVRCMWAQDLFYLTVHTTINLFAHNKPTEFELIIRPRGTTIYRAIKKKLQAKFLALFDPRSIFFIASLR
jgi:hypothetical protein